MKPKVDFAASLVCSQVSNSLLGFQKAVNAIAYYNSLRNKAETVNYMPGVSTNDPFVIAIKTKRDSLGAGVKKARLQVRVWWETWVANFEELIKICSGNADDFHWPPMPCFLSFGQY